MNNTEATTATTTKSAEKIAAILADVFVNAANRGSDPIAYVNEAIDVLEMRWPLQAKAAREAFAAMVAEGAVR
jgi:hypothetical protein